jgi:nucleotide-binding universal stress UspA family protein
MKPIRRLLVATDFSPSADAAAGVAAQLAEQLNAMIELLTVIDTSGWTETSGDPASHRQRVEALREEARRRAQAFADRHFARIDDVRVHVRDGEQAFREIVRAGDALQCDLIVMGTQGTTALAHLLIGSVAEKVVRTSAIPVLTVRRAT